MGSLSIYLSNKLLDHVLEVAGYNPAATLYIALLTADPTDAGTGSSIAEPTDNNYVRKSITSNAAASRKIDNSAVITFNRASGPWGTITYWAICDADTGGNMLAYGSLAIPKSVVANNTPRIAANEIDIEFSSGYISDYLALKMLDFAFRNQAFAQPNIHIALATVNIADSMTGSTITEPEGGSYARVDFAAWSAASDGALSNSNTVTFLDATDSWGTITAMALLDAASAGNLLMYDNAITDQAVAAGDTVEFSTGDLDITLD